MRILLRILARNIALLVALPAIAARRAATGAESWVFALRAVLALWVLFQGVLFASAHRAVLACAALGALLFLLQTGLLAFLIFWNRGFDATYPANALQVLLGITGVAGALSVGGFLRAKPPPVLNRINLAGRGSA